MVFKVTAAMFIMIVMADIIFGDYPLPFPHPVVLIGRLIDVLENWFYPHQRQDEEREVIAGTILVLIVCLLTFLLTLVIIKSAYMLWSPLGFLMVIFLGYTALAATGLARAAIKVLKLLEKEGKEEARKALSMIVGRDTAELDSDEILKAVVETVAENISDAVIAPLFFLLLGGVPLAMTYKAVNTMDSMIGYRNDRYKNFGRVAARLDDFANFIPARLSGLLIIIAGWMLGYDPGRGWRIMKKYHHVHKSLNSGYPEAAMAGLLGIELGGPGIYFGKMVDKGIIGESLTPIHGRQVKVAVKVLYLCTILMTGIGLWLLW
ncbi:MAG: adenosylcobinamide-phosphate synthase CbiB [Pseudomonadota bacterium]|nr:adenosylcobinamide-phosphate synthase CbiB [Pseudomonadota bacterium]